MFKRKKEQIIYKTNKSKQYLEQYLDKICRKVKLLLI